MEGAILPHHHGETVGMGTIMEQLACVDNFQTVADIFRQLADPTRIRIFWLLCHCEECVVNLSALLEMSSPAVSHHLRPLKDSGLIVSRRVGKEVYYQAADTAQSRLLHQIIEQVMDIACPQWLSQRQSDQVMAVREIHDYLLTHMDERVTIEELSRQYHINPTTLKAAFKSVYGTSIAAHIKQHRMEQAAKLLCETDRSIAQIAQAVGYDTQSKFSAAFKAYYGVLPRDFRKQPAPQRPAACPHCR
ncbi:MAG: metalloregulator ArsR/SmtB family transcription factor [Firmicutes bacterium]|nr:metalloregulator ArsR/SmtB family transcription factor [Bacillota bacterium]